MRLNIFLFTFIFLNFYNSGNAQSRYDVERRHSIDPIFSYYRGTTITEKRTDIENPLEGEFRNFNLSDFIRVGAKYNYAITPTIIVATGLLYSNPLTYIRKNPSPYYSTHGHWVPIRRSYVEIPLTLRYVYTKNWCKSFIEVSPMLQYMINNGDNSSYQKAGNFAIGAEFNLGGIATSFVQMNGYYQFSKVKQAYFTDQHIGMGFSVGSRIHFRI